MSNIATGTVSIGCNNTPPVANNDTVSIDEESSGYINLLANDVDIDTGDVIYFSGIIINVSNGSLTIS